MEKLSKSQFVKGVQCSKALFIYRKRKDLHPEVDAGKQAIFDMGHEVGELAKQVYSEGVEVTEEYFDIDGAIESTKTFIADGKEVIYEATAMAPSGLYSKIDILKKVRGEDSWDLIEVKASTRVKDYHIWDMASQRLAFEGAGFKVRKSILMHVNNKYVRCGEIDAKAIFTEQDCTEAVLERMEECENILPDLVIVLSNDKIPEVEIGPHCSSPFSCDYKGHCWSHIPDYSVYNITGGGKLQELLSKGITDVADIPEGFITTLKKTDIKAYKEEKVQFNEQEVRGWYDSLQYPLYYLDFETINPAVPPCDGMSPYKQYPFQFSLHVQDKPGGELVHKEYLQTEASDPRRPFAEELVAFCGGLEEKGSVIVYNRSFESGVVGKLANDNADLRKELMAIRERMEDLLIPFEKRWLYSPRQYSSASIKAVLPAFCPDFSYSDLDVADGGSASRYGAALIAGAVQGIEKDKIIKDLRAYCRLDTLAMVKLVDVIEELLGMKETI